MNISSMIVNLYYDMFLFFQWIIKREFARWLVMALIGILTGCIASVIDIAVKYTAELKFTYIKHCILDKMFPIFVHLALEHPKFLGKQCRFRSRDGANYF